MYDYVNIEEQAWTYCPCITYVESYKSCGQDGCWYGCDHCCELVWRWVHHYTTVCQLWLNFVYLLIFYFNSICYLFIFGSIILSLFSYILFIFLLIFYFIFNVYCSCLYSIYLVIISWFFIYIVFLGL